MRVGGSYRGLGGEVPFTLIYVGFCYSEVAY